MSKLRKVSQLLSQLDKNQLSFFLDFFLTEQEKSAISDRVKLTELLIENKLSQRDIAKKNQISIAKITRGSNVLKSLSAKQRQALEEMLARS
jgi:TrpR family transcriptional regulator, trp operon repressor